MAYHQWIVTKEAPADRQLVTNRKALFEYEILDHLEAGICLLGTEIKSVREGGLNFRDAHVEIAAGEARLIDCHIAPYSHGNRLNHDTGRTRKLLLHRREIDKLTAKVTERGLTVVPLRAYLKNGRVKIEIGLARGKKLHDKRESIRRREIERETRRVSRSRGAGSS
jgi:SsrA-binding protein